MLLVALLLVAKKQDRPPAKQVVRPASLAAADDAFTVGPSGLTTTLPFFTAASWSGERAHHDDMALSPPAEELTMIKESVDKSYY